MDQLTMVYLGLTILIPTMMIFNGGAFGGFGIPTILLCILTISIILMLNYVDFLIFPLFTLILGIKIIPAKGYYIPKNCNCVIKNVNGLYYATGYLTANVYNYIFTTETIDITEEQKLGDAPEKWERIVMSAQFPFRFSIVSVAEDIQKYREELEGIRGDYEFKLSKEEGGDKPDQVVIDELNKKMAVVDARVSRLSAGERPVNAIMYIETIAVGVSEKEAQDALTNQLAHLQTQFNSFDLAITRVMGREVYNLFNMNYLLPDAELLQQTFNPQG